jgi:hypothetical protein
MNEPTNKLGLGVMIKMLSGNEETVHAVTVSLGKTIKALDLTEKDLTFTFEDGSILVMWDDGQSCCESRYMRTDDDLKYYIRSTLMNLEIKEAASIEGDGDCHDIEFLIVTTSKGVFTMASHNEHNGYYGGFSMSARLAQPIQPTSDQPSGETPAITNQVSPQPIATPKREG